MTTRRATTLTMEISLQIRRQYLVTFDEEEAQDVWAFLNCLQERDYDEPFKRLQITDPARQADIMKAVSNLREALKDVPDAQSTNSTRHL